MPELPEVELARRYLEGHVLGLAISRVNVLDQGILESIGPEDLNSCLVGQTFVAIIRHGKQLFLGLKGGGCMTMHFGMTGSACYEEKGRVPDRHDRLVIDFNEKGHLVFNDQRKFGAISYAESPQAFIEQKRLGPDALMVSKKEFVERAISHRKPIKATLLDQHVVAGIGNLYSDEVLFQTKVHPSILSSELSPRRMGHVHRAMGEVLRASIDARSDFCLLPEGYMLRDRSAGAPCPRGNGHLKAMVVGGRTAFFCPSCQPSP